MPLDAAALKARFPALASASDDLTALCIADATSEIDRNLWIDTDVDRATMALAAHYVAVAIGSSGSGGQTIALPGGGSVETAGAANMIAVGDVKVAFASRAASGAGSIAEAYADGLASTPYGAEFLRLRARSFPAVTVA